jgi:hypothetical protein
MPLDQTDILAWAIGRFWWTGPVVLLVIFIILGT